MINALAVHVYAGGFSLGMSEHLNVLAHLENSTYGKATVEFNLNVDIQQKPWDLDKYPNIEVVFGNPPCAPWSNMGVQKGANDPRFQDTISIFDVAEHYNPKFIVFESVQNILKQGSDKLKQLQNRVLQRGYSITHLLHDAQDFGIPQRRKRYFFVAHNVEFKPKHPNKPKTTISKLLSNIDPGGYELIRPCDERFWHDKMHLIQPGQTMRSIKLKNQHNKTAIGCYRLNGDGVARAFVGDYTIIHHDENRPITVNEVKAICGFPKEYIITGKSRALVLKQISQGVMPPVAAWLGEQIKTSIYDDRHVSNPSVHYAYMD